MKNAILIQTAAISGALAVIIGAFGAHGLKPHLTEYQINIFEKGVQYHFIHTLAILLAGILWAQQGFDNKYLLWAGWFFLGGIVCFSGSLYLLACKDMLSVPISFVGPITPIGGVLFIVGWVMLFLGSK